MGQAADDMQDAAHHRKLFSTRRRAKSVGYQMTPDEKRIVRWLEKRHAFMLRANPGEPALQVGNIVWSIKHGEYRPTPGRTT